VQGVAYDFNVAFDMNGRTTQMGGRDMFAFVKKGESLVGGRRSVLGLSVKRTHWVPIYYRGYFGSIKTQRQ